MISVHGRRSLEAQGLIVPWGSASLSELKSWFSFLFVFFLAMTTFPEVTKPVLLLRQLKTNGIQKGTFVSLQDELSSVGVYRWLLLDPKPRA